MEQVIVKILYYIGYISHKLKAVKLEQSLLYHLNMLQKNDTTVIT